MGTQLDPEQGLSVFNLERTVVDKVFANALGDIAMLGLELPSYVDPNSLPRGISEQRSALLAWFTNKSVTEVEPFLDETIDQTGDRLAPWAEIVMRRQREQGHKLLIYSSAVPTEVVDAYAEGIQQAHQDIEIEWSFGKDLEKSGSIYTGQTANMLKMRLLERLEAKYGYWIYMIAESFGTAYMTLDKAERKVVVNPFEERDGVNNNLKVIRPEIVTWNSRQPDDTRYQHDTASRPQRFDLSLPDSREAFAELW